VDFLKENGKKFNNTRASPWLYYIVGCFSTFLVKSFRLDSRRVAAARDHGGSVGIARGEVVVSHRDAELPQAPQESLILLDVGVAAFLPELDLQRAVSGVHGREDLEAAALEPLLDATEGVAIGFLGLQFHAGPAQTNLLEEERTRAEDTCREN
jgi:hypothetical protein